MNKKEATNNRSRRSFLGKVGGLTAATIAAGAAGLPAISLLEPRASQAAEIGPADGKKRANDVYQMRHKAALEHRQQPLPSHPTNGDDEAYPNYIGSFTKGLPHDGFGEVNTFAYQALLAALKSGRSSDFDAIPLGGTAKFGNPLASYAFDMEGDDSHQLATPPPPALSSREAGGELVELYWQALTRDLPFSQYGTDASIALAVNDLQQFPNFQGVNASNIFRGNTPGDLAGPYLSQFLWKPIPYGSTTVTQRYRVPVPGDDHLTQYAAWLNVQNGAAPLTTQNIDPTTRFIRNGRDLTEWLHRDFTYQGCLGAALILLSFGPSALDDANPYRTSTSQGAFVTFGGSHILDLVTRVANCALKAVWYQKWLVHRRLRPEEMAGRVHNHKTGMASYPLTNKLLSSQALTEVNSRFGSYLLPQAYPEGSPLHPAYPSGHAVISGACTTVLKAFFKESFAVPSPVVAADDGLSLLPYGGTLTVGGELNKLATNISVGRNTAGIHYRTDALAGIRLGEAVALGILRDHRNTYSETFNGFSLTTFDGQTITI